MASSSFVDYYEALQVSYSADLDTIHRIYRILAQRYHPDHLETGNAELFRGLTEAYHVLGDAERRAAYDVAYRAARRVHWQVFDQSTSFQGVDAERRKREGVLSLLYRKRVMEPDQPYMTIKDMEDVLGIPREHLEFSLWFLREGQLVHRNDNGRLSITLKGAAEAENMVDRKSESTPFPMLSSATRVA
jgi:curved DNA-binding protein